MVTFRTNPIRELARQLRRSPKRLVLRHLYNIEFALTILEPDKTYPFEFVQHTITGVRAYANADAGQDPILLRGREVRQDLVNLAEGLSGAARLPLTACAESVCTGNQLADRFGVSQRTISRWRKRGLVAWKMSGDDGRLHTVFCERSIRRFVSENVGLVRRASNFSQLAVNEHDTIVARARELAKHAKASLHAVAVRIAAETGRGRETIRLILKNHDEAHADAPIFERAAAVDQAETRRLQIWEAYQDGAALDELSNRFHAPLATIYQIVTRMRAQSLKTSPIECVASDEFQNPDADARILDDADAGHPHAPATARGRIPPDLPPYLRELFDLPLLTPAGETALFRKMNYLKFKAEALRQRIDPETATPHELDELEGLLGKAGEVKNVITRANLRLVVRFAKRYQAPQHELFELISEGNMSLLRAVDLFDFTRGFKFSTYASWAIIRQLAGATAKTQKQLARFQTGQDEWCEAIVVDADADDSKSENSELLRRMADVLSRRQWYIISRHYGLEDRRQPQTLEEIGRRLGVSKERVRQIESKAIGQLRAEFADEVKQLWN